MGKGKGTNDTPGHFLAAGGRRSLCVHISVGDEESKDLLLKGRGCTWLSTYLGILIYLPYSPTWILYSRAGVGHGAEGRWRETNEKNISKSHCFCKHILSVIVADVDRVNRRLVPCESCSRILVFPFILFSYRPGCTFSFNQPIYLIYALCYLSRSRMIYVCPATHLLFP